MAEQAPVHGLAPHPLLGPRYQKGDCPVCWHAYIGEGQRLVIRHIGPDPQPGVSDEIAMRGPCPHPGCPRTYPATD